MKSTPPWTADQVHKLNEWQSCGWVHPFTCPTHSEEPLTPTCAGWLCLICGYSQGWAHDFMLDGAPPDPRKMFDKSAEAV